MTAFHFEHTMKVLEPLTYQPQIWLSGQWINVGRPCKDLSGAYTALLRKQRQMAKRVPSKGRVVALGTVSYQHYSKTSYEMGSSQKPYKPKSLPGKVILRQGTVAEDMHPIATRRMANRQRPTSKEADGEKRSVDKMVRNLRRRKNKSAGGA